MREYWGWCGTCQRAFYLGSSEDPGAPSRVECPVCLEQPAEIRIAEPRVPRPAPSPMR